MEDMAQQARFAGAMAAITKRLPFGLSSVVAPSLVGYLLINLCTFFIDLGLLAVFHGAFGWPVPVAVTLSYGTASALSYALNRVLNFRSHEYVGRQFLVFAAVSASNYLIFVLGLTDLLYHTGVNVELARVIAACCEAVYLYCMMRWVVFRDVPPAKAAAGQPAQAAPPVTPPPAPRPAAKLSDHDSERARVARQSADSRRLRPDDGPPSTSVRWPARPCPGCWPAPTPDGRPGTSHGQRRGVARGRV
jgi:putative flippase GtrA